MSCGGHKSTGRKWRKWCLSPFLLVSSLGFSQGEYKVSTDVVLVLLDVSVKDAKGGYVSGLSKNDFHVYENGVQQKITVFSSDDVPVAAGLVMDASGSVRPKRSELINAGLAFVGASNPQDQMFVINFNDQIWRGLPETVPFSDDIGLLRSALLRNRPEGRTALYDAIAFALHHLESGQRDKKTLVVVSDGGDNFSKHSLKETMRLIQESHATIYTIGIFDSDDADRNPHVLQRIASVSGGECFLPEHYNDVVSVCRTIAKDIRNRYTIGYAAARTSEKGLRKTHVAATAPQHQKLIVKTRTSYFLPESK